MQLQKRVLVIVIACMIMAACAQQQGITESAITSRLKIGMLRESAVTKLGDALKHYERPIYDSQQTDFFLYNSSDLEKATPIIFVHSKMINNTLTVYDFGPTEGYAIAAAYGGSCLGLSSGWNP